MNNQINSRQMEVIRSRVEQIRDESPWMESYEIEALICREFSLEDFDSSSIIRVVETTVKNQPQPVRPDELRVQEKLLENYSEIQPDAIGKFGAYEGRNSGPAQRRDMATRALYDLAKAAETDKESAAIVEKARAAITDNIKRESNRVGVTLGLALLVQLAMSVLLVIFTVLILGWSLDDVYDFITRPTSMSMLHAGLLLLAFGFPFIAYLYIHRLPINEIVPLHRLRSGELVPMIFMNLGVMMAVGCVENYISYPGAIRGASYSYEAISFGSSLTDILLTLVCMGIIPALIETFAFNGVILQVMRRRGGDGFALLFSSILYAAMTTNFVEMPGAFISNLMIGYMVIFSGSLVPAVVSRLIERLLFFSITQMGFLVEDAALVQYIDCIVTIGLILAGIISFFIMLQRFPELFVLKRSDPCLTTSQKMRIAMLRVPVILLVAFSLFFSFIQTVELENLLDIMENIFR